MAKGITSLNKDEEVVQKAEVNMLAWIPRIVIAVLFLLASLSGPDAFFPGLILACLIMARPVLIKVKTELAVTNKRVLGKTGLLTTRSMDIPLDKVNNIYAEQKLFGKIFNYGTVMVTSAGGEIPFRMIKNPEAFKIAVTNQIDVYKEELMKKQAKEMANAMRGTN